MLLGSNVTKDSGIDTTSLISQLIWQQRYAEAYQLLINQPAAQTDVLYNLALCLHWSGNDQEALSRLQSIQLTSQLDTAERRTASNEYLQIRSKQNQTADYLAGLSDAYIKTFPDLTRDSIVRLKTDCWLQLGNYDKVIAIATPIAHKGYKNITDALQIAQTSNGQRI